MHGECHDREGTADQDEDTVSESYLKYLDWLNGLVDTMDWLV